MARDIGGNPWIFDATGQGEGKGTSLLTIGTFTAAASNVCTMAGHGYATGNGPVQVTTSGGDQPAGISLTTDYWIIRLSSSTFSLATTQALARVPTAVDITDAGSGTHTIKQLPVFNHPVFVRRIIFTSAETGGACELTEGSGGNSLGSYVLSTNDREQIVMDISVDAVYVSALPATCKALVVVGAY